MLSALILLISLAVILCNLPKIQTYFENFGNVLDENTLGDFILELFQTDFCLRGSRIFQKGFSWSGFVKLKSFFVSFCRSGGNCSEFSGKIPGI